MRFWVQIPSSHVKSWLQQQRLSTGEADINRHILEVHWPHSLVHQWAPGSVKDRLKIRWRMMEEDTYVSLWPLHALIHVHTNKCILFHEGTVTNMLCSWFYFTEIISLEYAKEELKRSSVFFPPKAEILKKKYSREVNTEEERMLSLFILFTYTSHFLLLLHPCFPHFHSSDGDLSLEC